MIATKELRPDKDQIRMNLYTYELQDRLEKSRLLIEYYRDYLAIIEEGKKLTPWDIQIRNVANEYVKKF